MAAICVATIREEAPRSLERRRGYTGCRGAGEIVSRRVWEVGDRAASKAGKGCSIAGGRGRDVPRRHPITAASAARAHPHRAAPVPWTSASGLAVAGVHVRLRRNELIGFPGCVEQRAAEFLRERLRLIVDLK